MTINNRTLQKKLILGKMEQVFLEINEKLPGLLTTGGSDATFAESSKLIERCNLALISFTGTPTAVMDDTIKLMKSILASNESYNIDYDQLMDLMSQMVIKYPFDRILELFTVEELALALNSPIERLNIMACVVVEYSEPSGLFASTTLIDILLQKYLDEDSSVNLVNSIEKVWKKTAQDELIRRRILENNYNFLSEVKNNEPNSLVFTRLLELLKICFTYLKSTEFRNSLFLISKKMIMDAVKDNILVFISICEYFTSIFSIVQDQKSQNPSKIICVRNCENTIMLFGDLFQNRSEFPDIEQFALSYLFKMFKILSYFDDLIVFEKLDNGYIHIEDGNEYLTDFLSFISPQYLYKKHLNIIKSKGHVRPSEISIIRNLCMSSDCFDIIKKNITAEDILAMPYLEQMILLEKMSQYDYSVKFLAQHLPKVMGSLISKDVKELLDRETFDFRLQVINNLIEWDVEQLHIWYEPLTEAKAQCMGTFASKDVGTKIESSFS